MMMMKSAVLVLTLSCLSCEAQVNRNEGQNCDSPVVSMAQTLGAVTQRVTNMMEKITLLETKLQSAEKEVTELRSMSQGSPKVAFSAALYESGSGNTGPFATDTPLKYKRIFSSIDSSYNPTTGIFTARVKGMYYFRFSMFNNLSSTPNSVVSLKKNGERLTSVWDTSGSDANDMGSNAVVIPLQEGDNVYVELQANRVIYDDGMNYNTFSGFLLFTI